MSTGLDVFDRTLQTTNIWLEEIAADLLPDRQVAWKALTVVLHVLRDRLPVELAAHLGSQLPLLVRGTYYDQFQPSRQPATYDTLEAFVERVADGLSDIRPTNAKAAVDAVLKTLSHHVTPGQVAKIRDALPSAVRSSWETVEQDTPLPAS